jgi:hypothetical protein
VSLPSVPMDNQRPPTLEPNAYLRLQHGPGSYLLRPAAALHGCGRSGMIGP